jgi:hypothetical protein
MSNPSPDALTLAPPAALAPVSPAERVGALFLVRYQGRTRTTRRYDRARNALDGHAAYAVAGYFA